MNPSIVCGLIEGLHVEGFLFAEQTAAFGADRVSGAKTRGPMQPADEHQISWKGFRLASEVGENGLGHILGEMHIPGYFPEGDGIDKVNVTANDLIKRVLRPFLDVGGQQFVRISHYNIKTPRKGGNRQ